MYSQIKRTKSQVLAGALSGTWPGTNGKFILVPDADPDQRIQVKVPCNGIYHVEGYGTYLGIGYEIVDVSLHIVSVDDDRDLLMTNIFNRYNFNGQISNIISANGFHLKKDQVIGLGYGNLDYPGGGTNNCSFYYGFPGDYISISLIEEDQPNQ